jgi:hypothetical protein
MVKPTGLATETIHLPRDISDDTETEECKKSFSISQLVAHCKYYIRVFNNNNNSLNTNQIIHITDYATLIFLPLVAPMPMLFENRNFQGLHVLKNYLSINIF